MGYLQVCGFYMGAWVLHLLFSSDFILLDITLRFYVVNERGETVVLTNFGQFPSIQVGYMALNVFRALYSII